MQLALVVFFATINYSDQNTGSKQHGINKVKMNMLSGLAKREAVLI